MDAVGRAERAELPGGGARPVEPVEERGRRVAERPHAVRAGQGRDVTEHARSAVELHTPRSTPSGFNGTVVVMGSTTFTTRVGGAGMDLLAFGETMLRLTPPGDERIEAADSLDVHVGGAESNVAVAASRLGVDAAWTSKLPDSPPAHRIVRALREQGVEPLVAAGEGRVGTYYLETGATPRGTDVVYDRTGAAVRTTTLGDLPVDAVREASAFYTSGITPALSETLAETVAEAFEVAGDAGTEVVFDVNYRSKLWTPAAARETLTTLFEFVDTLIVAARDARSVLELDGDAATIARRLDEQFDFESVLVTRGDDGVVALADGDVYDQPAFEAETVDPVGTGDAFVGGYLAARIDGDEIGHALEVGAATAALKRTLDGDLAVVTRAEVDAVRTRSGSGIDR